MHALFVNLHSFETPKLMKNDYVCLYVFEIYVGVFFWPVFCVSVFCGSNSVNDSLCNSFHFVLQIVKAVVIFNYTDNT